MRNYDEKARAMGANYFASFDGFPGWTVVSAEKRFRVNIGAYPFVGIADLVLRNNEDGKLMVVDHKTKAPDAMKKGMNLFRHQLYIYAEHVRQEYGEYPATLAFNMIRTGEMITEDFDEERLAETVRWAADTIEAICLDFDYEPRVDDFHCRFLCNVRGTCPNCPVYIPG